ncbi:hypothetical protein CEXT_584631 [Caerostris extrusa]|uniref:Uncharacterized protein n=1 Tax=Caerostris extrusa TaxID=172846 RepID=A0AAV4U700_CAEEX|nr:hypothetical protein CEXT_584631 [Caerostris extrusa]
MRLREKEGSLSIEKLSFGRVMNERVLASYCPSSCTWKYQKESIACEEAYDDWIKECIGGHRVSLVNLNNSQNISTNFPFFKINFVFVESPWPSNFTCEKSPQLVRQRVIGAVIRFTGVAIFIGNGVTHEQLSPDCLTCT